MGMVRRWLQERIPRIGQENLETRIGRQSIEVDNQL